MDEPVTNGGYVCVQGSWSIFRHCHAVGWSDRILSLREINDTVLRLSPDSAPSYDGMNLHAAAKALETVIPSCRLTWIQDDDEATFLDTLVANVDSGFPILAEVREREHAVAVVGYKLASERAMPSLTERVTLRGVITGLYVSDDHHFPYRYVPCIVSETEKNGTRQYQVQHIRGFATVFPRKNVIDFDRAKTVLSKLVVQYGPSLWTPPRNESVTRIFARSWEVMKRHVCSSVNGLQVEEQERLNVISWPPHVWVAEISNPKNALGGVAATFISAAGTYDVSFSLCFSSHSVIVNSAGVNFILGRNGLGKPHTTVLTAVTTLTAYS
ncbi:hypothetical protein [Burkholderia sp. 9120]|uniref:hypothetical protein n=1 Tax=Burkholderia sp. 9120 TaxID=1500897 RepID=UPI0012E0B653|nr:hypothetical protein [Burkholderia sp. 9120]